VIHNNRLKIFPITRYVIGGLEGNADVPCRSTCESFDPSANTWTVCAPPKIGRRAYVPSVVGSDGKIYVFGAYYGQPVQNHLSVECYDPNHNEWSFLPPLPEYMMDCAAVALPNGKIYLFGGRNTSGFGTCASFCFDLKTHTYSRLPDLPYPSRSCRAVWI